MQPQDSRTPWMDAAAELDHALRARKGDRKAFAALLRHYHRPAYRLAFALTRDVRAAVAVTRSTALRARDGIRYMPEGVRFFPWVVHFVLKLGRSHREAGASDAPVERPRSEADVAELAERLQRAMDELDPDAQAALALRVVEQLPISMIETTLRVAHGNASSLLAGARWRLTARLGGGGEQRAGHLTPDHLSENLDGVLQGFRFDQVRIHLDMCDHCRLQGLRMASTNDVMQALLTHDPADRFYDALERFLEDSLHAKDPPDSIPPELDRLIAAEVKRIDADRWAAVRRALPRPIVAPVPAAGEEIASMPAAEAIPSHPRPAAGSPAPPRPTRPPSRPAMASAAQSTGTSTWPAVIGAAVVVLVLLIAGLYLSQRSTRSRAGVSRASTAGAPAPAGGTAQAPHVAALSAGPDASTRPAAMDSIPTSRADRASAAAPAAKVSAASPQAPSVREPKVQVAAETVAAEARMGGAAKPARAPAAPSPRAPVAAPESGILCGQVRDQSGTPVVGAQVLLADLHVGDRRGRFCISAPVGTRTLSLIALGFTTQRRSVTIERRTAEVAITLRSEAIQESTRDGGP